MINEDLRAKELYAMIAEGVIEPKDEYYRLLVKFRKELLFDTKLEGQAKIAELLSNKEYNLIMNQSRLSSMLKLLEVI